MRISLRKKAMTNRISELTVHVIYAAMCAILFIAQTLIYLELKFNEIAKPFVDNQTVWEYVYDSTKNIWMEMLIWPILLLLILSLRILSLHKAHRDRRDELVQ
jgi:hypothetical protein